MVEASALKNTYLAAGLTDEQLAIVGAMARVDTHPSGYLLAKRGDLAEEMYLLLAGEIVVTTGDGDKLGDIKAGGVVGEIALVDACPRAANVVSRTPITVAAWNIRELRKAMMEDREWGFLLLANVARVIATRLRQADEMIDTISDNVGDKWDHAMG
ncbi:MAG: cyclic nucleotide-binding domain-containing protein [Pirellula sp.]